jgi:hypothetical protein
MLAGVIPKKCIKHFLDVKNVPHRHFDFSIPKIIRIYFLHDRNLLKELTRIAWGVLGLYYKNSVNKDLQFLP